MSGTRKQRRRTRKVTIDLDHFHQVVEATSERALTADEQKLLRDAYALIERLATPVEPDESSKKLFGGAESGGSEPQTKPAGHGRRGRQDFKGATVVPVAHPDVASGNACACCGAGRMYPLKRPLYFRHFTGQAPIELSIYELVQMRCNRCENVVTAPLPEGIGPESYAPSAASSIAVSKYGLGLPFYRQALHLTYLGVPIAAATQYEVVAGYCPKLQPLIQHLNVVAAAGNVVYSDDASVKILQFAREQGDDRTGLFTTAIVSHHDEFKVALFFTGRNHAGENRADLIKHREPDLEKLISMTDALASNTCKYDSAKELIAHCLAHGRRNFVKILDSFPEECRHVIDGLARVYHNDSLSRDLEHDPAQRLAYHQEKSQPVMDELKRWLDEQIDAHLVEPNSVLGKAVNYMRNHWEALTVFLRVPGAPLDNNVAERALKKVILHRKNSLFFRSAQGAKVADTYMSLIQTCQLNDANPLEYLTDVLTHHLAAAAAPAEWMPWNYEEALGRARGPSP